MRILVTGGAGFIGSTIVDAYVALGHKVWAYDDLSSGKKAQVNPKATFVKGDVRDRTALSRLFKKVRFDVVNHHAAQIDVRRSVENPSMDAEINVMGILNILELSSLSGVRKVIFSSSGGTVYGECRRPAREGDPEVPLSPYGVAKLASEKYIQAFAALRGLRYTIFRYSNVYGPRQDPHGEAGVVAIFCQRFLSGKPTAIFGNGLQTRDFVFVGDVARANVMALRRADNEIINIGTGREVSVLELHRRLARIAGVPSAPARMPARKGELRRSVLNIAYARRALGWKPAFPIDRGLAATMAFFRR